LFDLSIGKLAVLAVLAVVIFGPEQLPRIAAQAGRALRELRRMAEGATSDLREGLGPEFADFDVTDLHPKNFVRKHLLEGFDDSGDPAGVPVADAETALAAPGSLPPGESPPYDPEAT
jgi:sec-independent protein translocase protein TatB